MKKINKMPSAFLCARWAQAFETNLLAVDNKALVGALSHRQRYFRQAVCAAAACAGKVRMTLAFSAVMGQFKMPRSFLYKSLMHQPDLQETFQGSVDCNLVEVFFPQLPGNLLLAQRLIRFHQHFQYGCSALGAVKLRCF